MKENKKDLRDEFAIAAMNAYINAVINAYMDTKCKVDLCNEDNVARNAYKYADAMMKARSV